MADTTSDKKVFTLAEVKQLAEDKNKCILIINNHIYDVTKFMDEVCKNVFRRNFGYLTSFFFFE